MVLGGVLRRFGVLCSLALAALGLALCSSPGVAMADGFPGSPEPEATPGHWSRASQYPWCYSFGTVGQTGAVYGTYFLFLDQYNSNTNLNDDYYSSFSWYFCFDDAFRDFLAESLGEGNDVILSVLSSDDNTFNLHWRGKARIIVVPHGCWSLSDGTVSNISDDDVTCSVYACNVSPYAYSPSCGSVSSRVFAPVSGRPASYDEVVASPGGVIWQARPRLSLAIVCPDPEPEPEPPAAVAFVSDMADAAISDSTEAILSSLPYVGGLAGLSVVAMLGLRWLRRLRS